MSRKTRKLIWSAPLVAAIAVIGALALFMTLTPNQAAAQTVATPGQVQNFAIEATGPTTIKLTWGAPTEGGRPTGYRIDVSDDGLTWELLSESVPGQDDEYDHDSLMARETKYYRIFAHNQGGGQIGPVAMPSPTSIATLASTVPDNPTDLTVEQGATKPQEQLDLEWTPPETPDGTTIYQYKVAFSQDPADLSLSNSRTLTVSEVPTIAVDKVYCGQDGSENCTYTFKGLLEHETWHFQVYAVNEDASSEVGASNASDSMSKITANGLMPAEPTAVWAAVNKNSPGIWLYWTPPEEPDGAPVTDYLIQGRPITLHPETTPPQVAWGDKPANVVVFHNRKTADFLLTSSELRRAAQEAWEVDDQAKNSDGNDVVGDLDDVDDLDTYFSNLEWEFRVFALNSVWKREVQNKPTSYTATLAHADEQEGSSPTTPVAEGTPVSFNRSEGRRVSLNELNETDSDDPTNPGVGDIAPTKVDLQNRITRVRAVKDNDTNGGRTKIDISWPRTYSHDPTPDMTDSDDRAYAAEYRIQWSTNPDASEWTLLDQTDGDPHNDFTAAAANCDADDTCTVSHTGRTAGTKYTYRVFAMNAESGSANTDNTVFSWWQVGSATTSQAEVPGRPLNLIANQSISNGHTEIDLVWNPPTSDHDGGGDGDGYGVIIEYDIEKSDDGGNSWSSLAMVDAGQSLHKGGRNGRHPQVGHQAEGKRIGHACVNTPTRNWRPDRAVRYRVLTVNVGPRERMSDWSDTTTQTNRTVHQARQAGRVCCRGRGPQHDQPDVEHPVPHAAGRADPGVHHRVHDGKRSGCRWRGSPMPTLLTTRTT